MALLSPGIQIFESSVTPAATVAPAENGVATLGFAKKGPVNKLTRIRSVSEFNEVFGDPIEPQYYAHILAQSVLANGTDVYFYRLADEDTLAEAQCPVLADFEIKGAKLAISNAAVIAGYLTAEWHSTDSEQSKPSHADELKFRVYFNRPGSINYDLYAEADAKFASTFSGKSDVIYVSLLELGEALRKAAGDYYNFTVVSSESEDGIVISAKNETAFAGIDIPFKMAVSIGHEEDAVWRYIASSKSPSTETIPGMPYDSEAESVENSPECLLTDTFGGFELRQNSTVGTFDNTLETYDRFNLVAKYPGSDMNGVKVVKTTVASSIGKPETWTVSVYNNGAQQPAESRTGITPENFLAEMGKFEYITVDDIAFGSGNEERKISWADGTWELGVGLILGNGDSWTPSSTVNPSPYTGSVYVAKLGGNGWPSVEVNNEEQYSESRAAELYVKALSSDDFINTDEFSYSILATPGIQRTLVQNAAINVCATRGDAIYLADIPRQYCEDKNGIDEAVAWANGNSGFQSSYCAIYYGWFYQTNPYNTESSIACPASCFIAPKMVALDQSMGEFFAPAGITRGGLICSDWSYSPDQKDRDKLVGNDNVINPISYSSTRGVTIMAQKTTDRTTSPLNRVGTRRMTNAIKRNLRSQLVALIFEPNNETARARARVMVDNIMSNLRTRECIESYDINIVSGTGAARNELYVYLSFAPYGLIEKIYVYLSVTDAGVEVTCQSWQPWSE